MTYQVQPPVMRLEWGEWIKRPSFRSWDLSLELRRAETPFGEYRLLRREAASNPQHLDRFPARFVGKWFLQRPGAAALGPFDNDVTAIKAAQRDFDERVAKCLQPRVDDPASDKIARLQAAVRAGDDIV